MLEPPFSFDAIMAPLGAERFLRSTKASSRCISRGLPTSSRQ